MLICGLIGIPASPVALTNSTSYCAFASVLDVPGRVDNAHDTFSEFALDEVVVCEGDGEMFGKVTSPETAGVQTGDQLWFPHCRLIVFLTIPRINSVSGQLQVSGKPF